MNILVCFKTVPDTEMLPDAMWRSGDGLRVDLDSIPPAWNCYEESALALALKYTTEYGGQICALTIGGNEGFLKTLLALGFSGAVSIQYGGDIRFRSELVSELIAGYVRKAGGFGAVLLGSRSTDGNSGLTGPYLAERMGMPLISLVSGFKPAGEGSLSVSALTDRFETETVVRTPCVMTIGNSPVSYLPVPDLKARMRVSKRPVERLLPEDLGVDPFEDRLSPAVKLVGMKKRDNKRAAQRIFTASPAETAEVLYSQMSWRLKSL